MVEQANLKKLSDFDNNSLLIVDDDNPFRDRLARAMEKKGFQVFQAEGVKKGIQTVKEKKPCFAVVDLQEQHHRIDSLHFLLLKLMHYHIQII